MAITADYHLHSYFSGDSDTPTEEMILKGIELGLTQICFTEHMDIDYVYENPSEKELFTLNTDSYLYELATLKEKYADKINVLFGVELGLQPHLRKELALYSKSYEFDFIIGSSHLCNRQDPFFPSFYEGRSDEEAYREYFNSILDNIKSFSNFDVYGHLDYVVRYGRTKDRDYSYDNYKDIFEQILLLLLEKEIGLEINTKAILCNLKELHPCTAVLKRYRELGGEIITVGSDAHSPSALCSGFDKAAEVLKSCGFRYYTTFEKRTAEFHRIQM